MKQARILIIDDDPDIIEAMKVILENAGFLVSSAPDSSEGVRQMETEKPDLIILDVMMSTLNEGFVLCRELKKNPEYKAIPILMITAVGKKVGIDFESAAGDQEWLPVEGFLSKPVKPGVLLEKVKSLLQK